MHQHRVRVCFQRAEARGTSLSPKHNEKSIPVGLWQAQSWLGSWRWSWHCDSQRIPEKSHLWSGCQAPQVQWEVRGGAGPWGRRAACGAAGTCSWGRAFPLCSGMRWQRGGSWLRQGWKEWPGLPAVWVLPFTTQLASLSLYLIINVRNTPLKLCFSIEGWLHSEVTHHSWSHMQLKAG